MLKAQKMLYVLHVIQHPVLCFVNSTAVLERFQDVLADGDSDKLFGVRYLVWLNFTEMQLPHLRDALSPYVPVDLLTIIASFSGYVGDLFFVKKGYVFGLTYIMEGLTVRNERTVKIRNANKALDLYNVDIYLLAEILYALDKELFPHTRRHKENALIVDKGWYDQL